MNTIKVGIIGLDTSHAVAFTKLLNDHQTPHHVAGAKVLYAYKGGSPHSKLSMQRIEKITATIRDSYDVEMVETLQDLAEKSDAILLESVDGGQHLEQLKEIITYQKPIFIDKPFALSIEDANEMIALSKRYKTPIMSASALRFANGLVGALQTRDKGEIIGADCFGPMEMLREQAGYFWYGIHTIEMLYTIFGPGMKSVSVMENKMYDVITAVWKDGRIGTVRGNRVGEVGFGAVIHFEKGAVLVDVAKDGKPFYASLLEEIIAFFKGESNGVPLEETAEIMRFIELANEKRTRN